MEDREFYDRLSALERALSGGREDPLPSRDELGRVRAALLALGRDPSTGGDRERVAALDAVYAVLGRVTGMVEDEEAEAARQ
jgi:hypothetical protein